MNLLSWWTERATGVIASKTLSNRERERLRERRIRPKLAYGKYLYVYIYIYTFTYICTVLYISWLRFNTWLLSPILSNSVSFPSPVFRSRSFILTTIDRYPDLKYFYFLLLLLLLLLFILRNIVIRHSNPKPSPKISIVRGKVQIKFQFRISPDPLENGQGG